MLFFSFGCATASGGANTTAGADGQQDEALKLDVLLELDLLSNSNYVHMFKFPACSSIPYVLCTYCTANTTSAEQTSSAET